MDGIPIAYRGPDVIIRDTRINKPTSSQFPNFPTHPNIPHWPTPPIVYILYTPPAETIPTNRPPKGFSDWKSFYAKEKLEYSITPYKMDIGANKTYLFKNQEALQPTERYDYLTRTDKYEAFKTNSERSDYYRWVNKQLEGKSKWFGAMAIITEAYGVSAAEGLNGPFLNDAAIKYLKAGNDWLFRLNIENACSMIYKDSVYHVSGFDPNNNKTVLVKGKKGKFLDDALVEIEQLKLHSMLEQYKTNNPISEVNNAIRSINEVMGSPRAPQEVREVMDETVQCKKRTKSFRF